MTSKTYIRRSWQWSQLAGTMAIGRTVRDSETARKRIAARWARMQGLPQKIGQILSLTELESEDQVWTQLTEESEAMSPYLAFAEIESALGMSLDDASSQISEHGIAVRNSRLD